MKSVVAVVVVLVAICASLVTAADMGRYNARKGKEFLAKKAQEPGVVSLPEGVLYKVLQEGKGKKPSGPEESVTVHYRGTLIDGKEFDSSYNRGKPADFALNQVIKGWTVALQHMKEGDKWEIYIPSELAYGENGPPTIGPNQTLIFEVELIKCQGVQGRPAAQQASADGKKAKRKSSKKKAASAETDSLEL